MALAVSDKSVDRRAINISDVVLASVPAEKVSEKMKPLSNRKGRIPLLQKTRCEISDMLAKRIVR